MERVGRLDGRLAADPRSVLRYGNGRETANMTIIGIAWLIVKVYIALLIAPVILWLCAGVFLFAYHLFVIMVRALIPVPRRWWLRLRNECIRTSGA